MPGGNEMYSHGGAEAAAGQPLVVGVQRRCNHHCRAQTRFAVHETSNSGYK